MTRVGILVSLFLSFLFLCFWPSVVPNQRQLSIVVSDWESSLGSPFSPLSFAGSSFCTSCYFCPAERHVRILFFVLLLSVFS